MKKGLFLIGFTLTTSILWGQIDKRYIEVIGSAESEITPNIIVVSVRLKEYDENKIKVTLDKIESGFLEGVTRSKISKDKVELSDLTLNGVSQKRREREYYSQKTYQVTFSKTEDVLTLLDNLKNVKLDYLDIVKLSNTEIEKYRLELKIEALKQAEKKADALLNSVGVKRGRPLIINENLPTTDWPPRDAYANSYLAANQELSSKSEIPLRKIKLRFEILARFEME